MRLVSFFISFLILVTLGTAQEIPLPEHPNPIKKRGDWQNLNGYWDFQFDDDDKGITENWQNGDKAFDRQILVPFPWGSNLSEVQDEADIGWYKRSFTVTSDWLGKRVFLIVGAADWDTHIWIDGRIVGSHKGGYIPFEFEITDFIQLDANHELVIRVDDKRRTFTLYGKQGYGNARGIWQTPYLEARGQEYIEDLHVTPDIDQSVATVTAYLPNAVNQDEKVNVTILNNGEDLEGTITFKKGQRKAQTTIEIPDQRLWTLDDPNLYDINATYKDDQLQSYFGMRKISVMNLPGTDYPYVALNNEPIYLQLALDQSYHPDGFYTFPSEQFIIEEIYRSKSIGLNGIRTHIKVEIPRKLYWADRLGLLVMEDLPNSWGEPEEKMQEESVYTLREMIKRDYNHPSIFSWVIANETWGLFTDTEDGRKYLPETQQWLVSMYYLAKSLDPSRLIEDNSICCGRGHTVTDINSWHVYLPGYAWEEYLANLTEKTFPGSSFNYEDGYVQGSEPNFNSECGNVWGYQGSAGDVDWTWDYHRMINTFRKYPEVGGWLYTEHHDVINEWNGYWRFDRSKKETGLGEIVPDMDLNDLHSDIYLSTGQDISYTVDPGSTVSIPLYLSSMTDRTFEEDLILEYEIETINYIGQKSVKPGTSTNSIEYRPWAQLELDPLKIKASEYPGISTIRLFLKTNDGEILHRNFVHLIVKKGAELEKTITLTSSPTDVSQKWTQKYWEVMKGKKVNGAGSGYFEFTIEIPDGLSLRKAKEAYVILEASAKELFVKDQEEYNTNQDFMKGSVVAPSSNPNSYPMTDETFFPSEVAVSINGKWKQDVVLPDDPADHRGVLSWHAQLQDRKLREAGSYGYLLKIDLDRRTRRQIEKKGALRLRVTTKGKGGIAIYGKDFGRYPFDPSLVVIHK